MGQTEGKMYLLGKWLKTHMSYNMLHRWHVVRNRIFEKGKQNWRDSYWIRRKKGQPKKLWIIRWIMPNDMLFFAGMQYAFAYDFVKKHGGIPIFDLEFAYDFERYRLGEENLWEEVFTQEITVKEAIKQDHVFVEAVKMPNTWDRKVCMDINGAPNSRYIHARNDNWREYFKKVHKLIEPAWTFKPEIIKGFDEKYGKWFNTDEPVLGVMLREFFTEDAHNAITNTNFINYQSKHPRVPGLQDILKIVKYYKEKWGCKKVFIATQAQESYDMYQNEFGEDALFVDRKRHYIIEYLKTGKIGAGFGNKEQYEFYHGGENTGFIERSTIPYVNEVLCASKCDYLIGTPSGGLNAAMAINGGVYKDSFILEDINNSKWY